MRYPVGQAADAMTDEIIITAAAKLKKDSSKPGFNKVSAKSIAEKYEGVQGHSALLELKHTGFNMVLDTPIDLMHVVSGVIGRHLIPLLQGNRKRKAYSNAVEMQQAEEEEQRNKEETERMQQIEHEREDKRKQRRKEKEDRERNGDVDSSEEDSDSDSDSEPPVVSNPKGRSVRSGNKKQKKGETQHIVAQQKEANCGGWVLDLTERRKGDAAYSAILSSVSIAPRNKHPFSCSSKKTTSSTLTMNKPATLSVCSCWLE